MKEAREINIFVKRKRQEEVKDENKGKWLCEEEFSITGKAVLCKTKKEEKGEKEEGKTRKLELMNAHEGIQKAFFVGGKKEERDINEQELISGSGRKGKREKEAGLEL